MVKLDPCADRRLRIVKAADEGGNCCFFTKRNDAGRAEHVDVAAAERNGCVPLADDQRCLPDEPLRDVHGVSLATDKSRCGVWEKCRRSSVRCGV